MTIQKKNSSRICVKHKKYFKDLSLADKNFYTCFPRLLVGLGYALSLSLICFIFFNLDKGLELSDEGVYFYSIQNPTRLLSLPSDFATPLHYIYLALSQSFYALRVFGLTTLLLLTSFFASLLLIFCHKHSPLPPLIAGLIVATLCAASCAYYSVWMPTPSYNWMALTGILGVLSALLWYSLSLRPLASKVYYNRLLRWASLLMLGTAGAWVFVGKGTVGAGAAVLALLWIGSTNGLRTARQRLVDIMLAGIFALIVLASYFFFLTEGVTITLQKIFLCVTLFDSTYGIQQVLKQYMQFLFPLSYIPVLLLWLVCAALTVTLHRRQWHASALLLFFTALYLLAIAWLLPTNKVIGMCVLPLYSITVYIAWHFRTSLRHFIFYAKLSLILFFSGFIYHAGTNIELSLKMTEALILPAAAGLVVLMGTAADIRMKLLVGASLIICIMSWASLSKTITETYRHNGAALHELTTPVELSPQTRPLRTSPQRKIFIDWLKETAQAHDWKKGTPLLCTSFYITYALHALDAQIVSASWQLEKRYTPSHAYKKIFGQVSPATLRQAWILKPVSDGPRHMPSAELANLGLPFPEGYTLVGVTPPDAAQGVWPAEAYELWKPRTP